VGHFNTVDVGFSMGRSLGGGGLVLSEHPNSFLSLEAFSSAPLDAFLRSEGSSLSLECIVVGSVTFRGTSSGAATLYKRLRFLPVMLECGHRSTCQIPSRC
jgi:hypothetical protein